MRYRKYKKGSEEKPRETEREIKEKREKGVSGGIARGSEAEREKSDTLMRSDGRWR